MKSSTSFQTTSSQAILVVGEPKSGKSFADAPDVLAHEYTHRIVNNVLGLSPEGESGAVNESLADTMATAYDTKNWTIGENVIPGGIRSLEDPSRPQDAIQLPVGRRGDTLLVKKTPLPSNIQDYIDTDYDNGGVHINIGILNHVIKCLAITIRFVKNGIL